MNTPDRFSPKSERIVPLPGGHNFRDLGGYRTADGRQVAWGQVFRSGTMARFGADDHAIMDRLGIRVVCDLRTTAERRKHPSAFHDQADYDVWARDYDMSGGNLIEVMRAPDATRDLARARMIALYHELPIEQAPSYRELFRRLAEGPLPLVFHCSAGKDRTGIGAALLLDLLGVERDAILADYAMTDLFIEPLFDIIRADPIGAELAEIDPAIWQPMMNADRDYLAAMFRAIEKDHGSVGAFLAAEVDVNEARAEAIRDRLLVSI